MTDWIEEVVVDPDEAAITKINRAGSPFKFAETCPVNTGDTVAGMTLVVKRPLTDQEREALRVKVIQLGDSVEPGLIVDLSIAKGFTAFKEFPGREWKFTLEGHLRTDAKPTPIPAPPE